MLKNLKSLFIVEDEDGKTAAKPKAPTKVSAPKAKPSEVSPATNSSTESSVRPGKVTQKFTDILLSAMDKANLDGFDYLEYKKSLQSLQKMNMVEETAYQSAFAMASTMGATPAHLVQTAEHYLKVLTAEEKKFESALANQQQSRVQAQQEEQVALKKTIKDKTAQIQRLQAEIEQHQAKLKKLDNAIGSAVSKIENTKNDFIASYKNLTKQISEDVDKMKKYLK